MKKYILLAIALILIQYSCKKNNSNDLNPIAPINKQDSIAKHISDSLLIIYGSQITNVNQLSHLRKIYTDSMKNDYLVGNRNKNFWIGVFSVNKNKLNELTISDPDSLKINYKTINRVSPKKKEIENTIFIPRFIINKKYEDNLINFPYIRNLIAYNYKQNTFSISYEKFKKGFGNEIYSIIPWFKGEFIIKYRGMLFPKGKDNIKVVDSYLKTLFDNTKTKLSIPNTYDYLLSSTDYIEIRVNAVSGVTDWLTLKVRRSTIIVDSLNSSKNWKIKKKFPTSWYMFFPESERAEVKILKKELKGNILSIKARLFGVQKDCSTCSTTHQVDDTISLKLNIISGVEL